MRYLNKVPWLVTAIAGLVLAGGITAGVAIGGLDSATSYIITTAGKTITSRTCDPNVDVCNPDPTTSTVQINPPCPGCTTTTTSGGGGGGTTTTVPTPPTTTSAPAPLPDRDNDGVADQYDNCPWDYNPQGSNPGQRDSDGNGVGDRCQKTFYGTDPVGLEMPITVSEYQDQCTSVRGGPVRCLSGAVAQNERCWKLENGMIWQEAISHRTLLHQRFWEWACGIPGVRFTRMKPETIGTKDETNTLYTYPWQTSVKSGPQGVITGSRTAQIYVQFDMVQKPVFVSPVEGFHMYPWIESHWYLPADPNLKPQLILPSKSGR